MGGGPELKTHTSRTRRVDDEWLPLLLPLLFTAVVLIAFPSTKNQQIAVWVLVLVWFLVYMLVFVELHRHRAFLDVSFNGPEHVTSETLLDALRLACPLLRLHSKWPRDNLAEIWLHRKEWHRFMEANWPTGVFLLPAAATVVRPTEMQLRESFLDGSWSLTTTTTTHEDVFYLLTVLKGQRFVSNVVRVRLPSGRAVDVQITNTF